MASEPARVPSAAPAEGTRVGEERTGRWPAGRGPRAMLAVLALLLGLYLLRVPILRAVGHALVVDQPPLRSDLILLLNGDVHNRPSHAARLYRSGVAPVVVVAREESRPAAAMGLYPNGTDVAVEILRRSGVPRHSVVMLRQPGGVTSTTDEARALRRYLAARPARRVTVVTSDYHTRRARWMMRRELRGVPVEVRMSAARDERFGPDDWWRTEAGLILYFEEYLKFVHNWIFR